MIFNEDLPIIQEAEAAAETGTVNATLKILRRLTPLDFGVFHLGLANPAFPNLSRILPRMASAEIQRGWTGSADYDLFRQTKDFVLRMQLHFETICRRSLRDTMILDYGCGWGRLARVMTFYTNPENFYAVDPMVQSIDICREHGLLGNLAVSDYLPVSLPVSNTKFDLIYSYSVFTHTSQRATLAALNSLRHYIKSDGLLILTVRPVEIWNLATFGENETADPTTLIKSFIETGFSFLPNIHYETDGDLTYGVTAMSSSWISANVAGWRVIGRDRGEDHLQLILLLTPC